jgi:DNA polymerase I-like protein with 3'-5' exonuclease and polymerase domains
VTSSHVILDEARLREAVDYLLTQPGFAFDVESQGENRGIPHLCEVSWLGLASDGIAAVIPMSHPVGEQIGTRKEPRIYGGDGPKAGKTFMATVPVWDDPPPQLRPDIVFEITEPLFMSERLIKVAHGITYDVPAITKYLPEMPCAPLDDTMVLPWLIDENLRNYALKPMTKRVYGVEYDFENVGKCVESFGFNKVAHYNYMDVLYTWFHYQRCLPQIHALGLDAIHAIEQDLMPAMCAMRLAGQPVDVPKLEALRDTLSARLVDQEGSVYSAAGRRFNINSAPQKQELLFLPKDKGGQGLQPWKLTDGGQKKKDAGEDESHKWYSTDDEVLEGFPRNPLANALRDYGDTHKLLNTYVVSWLGNGEDKPCQIFSGRIHAGFKQGSTVTGRFSCSAPNLQNIPRPDTPDGKLLRETFIACLDDYCMPDLNGDEVLVVGDLGQIELVILAHLIGYGHLFEGFWNGIDPHTVHAAGVLGKAPEDVTKDERQALGKTLGFTIVNGAGPSLVGSMIGGDYKDGLALMKKYDKDFPEVPAFKRKVFEACRDRTPPHVVSLLGRRRTVPSILSGDRGKRSAAERQVFNSLIQGGAADLIKLGMIRTDDRLQQHVPEAYLTMTIHDELVAVSPRNKAEQVRELMIDGMTGPGIQRYVKVPLTVECSIGERWSDCK